MCNLVLLLRSPVGSKERQAPSAEIKHIISGAPGPGPRRVFVSSHLFGLELGRLAAAEPTPPCVT